MSWRVGRSLDQLLAEINASAPGRNKASDGSIGDASHSSSTSDHNPCDCHDAVCARDFTHDPAGGFDSYAFANWLAGRVKHAEPRVKYIISNGRIASGQGQSYPAGQWRTYTGSNPHDHHVHVSVRHGAEHFDNVGSWDWRPTAPLPTPPPQLPEKGNPMSATFLIFDGVARGVCVGQVLYGFSTDPQYEQAREASPDVPELHMGEAHDLREFWERLNTASRVAEGRES